MGNGNTALGGSSGAYVGAGAPSAWQANHAYSVGQTFTNGGATYIVDTAYTSGASFGSTDISNTWTVGTPGPWTAFTLINGWQGAVGGYYTPSWRLEQNGTVVRFKGLLSAATATATAITAAISSIAPAATVDISAIESALSNNTSLISVSTAGVVTASTGSGSLPSTSGNIPLDGITYSLT